MTGTMQTVYFMRQTGARGPVKIGCSSYLPGRLDNLSVWSPVPLEVAASFPGGYKEERALHFMFRDTLSHHEWFHWSPELEAVIRSICDDTFDVATLPFGHKLARRRWSAEARRRASYTHRLRHAERRSGMRLPAGTSLYEALRGDATQMAVVEAFIADPYAHGQARPDWDAARKAAWAATQAAA